jgi:hypothetical protein
MDSVEPKRICCRIEIADPNLTESVTDGETLRPAFVILLIEREDAKSTSSTTDSCKLTLPRPVKDNVDPSLNKARKETPDPCSANPYIDNSWPASTNDLTLIELPRLTKSRRLNLLSVFLPNTVFLNTEIPDPILMKLRNDAHDAIVHASKTDMADENLAQPRILKHDPNTLPCSTEVDSQLLNVEP